MTLRFAEKMIEGHTILRGEECNPQSRVPQLFSGKKCGVEFLSSALIKFSSLLFLYFKIYLKRMKSLKPVLALTIAIIVAPVAVVLIRKGQETGV